MAIPNKRKGDLKMNTSLIILLIIISIMTIIGIVCLWLYLKQNSLEKIRVDVYQLFLKAENFYKHGDNKTKFKYVIQQARGLLPSWSQFLISDILLETTIEFWFRSVKDLLDDGKMNKSS